MTAFVWAMIAMFSWAVAPLLGKMGLAKIDPLPGLTARMMAVTAILVVALVATGQVDAFREMDRRSAGLLIGEGIFAGLIGHFAFYYALKLGLVSEVVPVTAAARGLTVLLAFLLFRESISPTGIVGLLLILGGIILVGR